MSRKTVKLLLLMTVLSGCIPSLPVFKTEHQPLAPDYSNELNWTALPFRTDAADMIPSAEKPVNDSVKRVDVFYVYPTLYLRGKTWNAATNRKNLNKKIDKYPVRYQASVFNRAARIYAPRYRQARLSSFIDTTGSGEKALSLAYEDVKRAFEYYMQYYNMGRPVIIASHSQGTWICRKLLKDFFDTPDKKKQLVCAYIIGYAVDASSYSTLSSCKSAEETNCFVTWSTFKSSYAGKGLKSHTLNMISVNPVSWRSDSLPSSSAGGILFNINRKKRFKTESRVLENNLWTKTNAPVLRHMRNLHILDYNLFWYDIRNNVDVRVNEYFKP
jgi:hypothetical protein